MGLTYSVLNMEAVGSSETLIICRIKCHIAGDSNLYSKDYENLNMQV
jgi:hypothetical protein